MPAFLNYLETNSETQQKIKNLREIFEKVGGLNTFLKTLNISDKLSDYGIIESEFDLFVEKTICKGDIQITPGTIDRDRIKQLYLESF